MSIQRIQAAVVDGRARTPRYIQKQLTLLHDALVRNIAFIHQAITKDTGNSSSEVWFEIFVTVRAVKQQFLSINFKDTLEQEYSLTNGKNNTNRRIAYGCAYVIPASNSRFYSIVQPIAAAIAAGNCVVVELKQTLLEVESLLRRVLTSTLDKDTFAIVDQRPSPDKFFTEHVVVVNATDSAEPTEFKTAATVKSSARRTIAIVDRSSNFAEAAKHIVRARFRCGGKSPYAPDVVFVNEFALKEFCQAAMQSLTEDISESVTANGTYKPQQSGSTGPIHKDLQQAGSTVLVSGARGSIHLLKQRQDSVLSRKISESILIITPISSFDDAIDMANSGNSLLATYFFADAAAAKYLSQFITSDVSFTNHIPSQLLVGPPAPSGYPLSLDARYTKEMLSKASPEYIIPTPEDKDLSTFLDGPVSAQALSKFKADIQTPLPSMGEPMTTTVGFFEQGIVTGLSISATLLLGVVGVCARYTIPVVWHRIRG